MVTCFQRSLIRSILLCGSIVTGAAGQTTDYGKFKQEAAEEYSVGNLEQAEVLVRKALEVAERRGDDRSIATMLVDLGNIYQREDRLGDASRHTEVQIADTVADPAEVEAERSLTESRQV